MHVFFLGIVFRNVLFIFPLETPQHLPEIVPNTLWNTRLKVAEQTIHRPRCIHNDNNNDNDYGCVADVFTVCVLVPSGRWFVGIGRRDMSVGTIRTQRESRCLVILM